MRGQLTGILLLVACSHSGTALPDSGASTEDGGMGCVSDVVVGEARQLTNGQHVVLSGKAPSRTERGDNTWTFDITEADGGVASGASVGLRPFMPAHGHATNPAEYQAHESAPGTYVVGPFNLFMPGDWRLTLRVQSDVSAVYELCVE